MRKQLFAVALAAALPLTGLAQGGQGGPPPATGAGPAQNGGPRGNPERMEKRMKLARTLGLAEALDLDAPQALKLGDTIAKFDERRVALHKQLRDSRDLLRRAAQGEKVAAAEVDQAIQRALDARAQLQAVDRETVAAVTQGLTPEKKARAVLFLSKFERRFGGHGPGMGGPGMQGRGQGGMGGDRGMGPRGGRGGPGGGMGMGPGGGMGPRMGMGPPNGDDFDDDGEE